MDVNEKQKVHLLPKIKSYFNNNLKGKKIALWGLAFKPNTDDIREAPALNIIEELLKEGAEINAYDPEAMNNVKAILGNKISFSDRQYDALTDADILIIATEWSEFRTPDFNKIISMLKNKVIFDGRNLFDLKHMEELGFNYVSVGRRTVK
jgi:UDPglucose 6-dehydrogenase